MSILDIPLAQFDSRVWQITEPEEIVNYFLWRQRDAIKNSISALAQSLYSSRELYGKNGNDRLKMCKEKGHNWDNLHPNRRQGTFFIKDTSEVKSKFEESYFLVQDFRSIIKNLILYPYEKTRLD